MRSLAESFSIYFHGLRAAVATPRSSAKERLAFVSFVWAYLMALSGRIDRLISRWRNGTLPRPRAPRPARKADKPRPAPAFRLPRRHMWLVRDIPATIAFASQLRHLIATDPQLHEFLKAAPQGRRLLNPLCRMLGIDFDKPYGVPLVIPAANPEPSGTPPPETPPRETRPSEKPPVSEECAAHSSDTAQPPPVVFSSP